jgi:hypothetical protein
MAIWKKNQRNRAYSASTESKNAVKRNLGRARLQPIFKLLFSYRSGNAYHDISLTYKYMENFPEAVRLVIYSFYYPTLFRFSGK